MYLQFLGAAREVTGSCHLLTVAGKQILLDCGMFQGHRKESIMKNFHFLFDATEISAVVLSHAHIDHSGRLPLLYKKGYRGKIIATPATRDLCEYMLLDSAYIQEKDAEYLNRKFPGKETLEPLYTMDDAREVMDLFVSKDYEEWFSVTDEVQAKFINAGHVLGAALIILKIKEQGKESMLGFTGDLGRPALPILKDPSQVKNLDFLITESTYGDRLHEDFANAKDEFKKTILETIARGGKIIIPAFALERTQEIIYTLHQLYKAKEIPPLPVYLDSPLAINVTEVFGKHPEAFDKKVWQDFLNHQEDPFEFGTLKYTRSVEESKALNDKHGPMIIISASGMCENGRIQHHLKNNLEDHRNTILLVGYMAEGTLGRKLADGAETVGIFGVEYRCKAQIKILDAFSAHADRRDLLAYIGKIKGLGEIFVCHGEEQSAESLAAALRETLKVEVAVPFWEEKVELTRA